MHHCRPSKLCPGLPLPCHRHRVLLAPALPRRSATAMPSPSLPTRLRFAPLNPVAAPPSSSNTTTTSNSDAPALAGIIFDMDGTLTLSQSWMFAKMRQELSIPVDVDILAHVASLPGAEAAAAMETVRAVEREAMVLTQPSPGLAPLMAHLERRGVRKAILTRNYECGPAAHVLSVHVVAG